jgi:hypothetical protein
MTNQTSTTGPWSIESWAAFWGNPTPEVAAERVPQVVAPDVVGYWPRASEPVRGREEYSRRIIDLLTLVPDLRLELVEHATNGDVVFLRWRGRGTGPDGPFEAVGADRVIATGGIVQENLILSDHPIFATLAERALST